MLPHKALLAHVIAPLACLTAAPAALADPVPPPPLTQNGGSWQAGHVQGIAVDRRHGYIYYSFTTLLAKYDFNGKLIGTLLGWSGHLGDLDFNAEDGKVYGSLEYKKNNGFYIAIIDVDRIDHVGIVAQGGDIMRTVYLPEVVKDYSADVNGDGVFDGDDGKYRNDVVASPDHRYDCSGIDGVGFGPAFGQSGGKTYLTVAYGIYGNTHRMDNDHQVLLQYDIANWARYAAPLSEAAPHTQGPEKPAGKYFLRTGNTAYGVQNLSYDPQMRRWFLGVYQGSKPAFPNYLLFAVDARDKPALRPLIGVPGPGGKGWEQGMLLDLAQDGLSDPATGMRGWKQEANVGFQPMGGGLFYIAAKAGGKGQQSADLRLMRWTGDAQHPFEPATKAMLRGKARQPVTQPQ